MNEKVTLYIPCYNAQKYILESLEGVLFQTYPIDEILIIDDGPEDGLEKILAKFPVTIIKRRGKKGLPSARNLAIRTARNELVASVDVDCKPYTDWLEKLILNFVNEDVAGVGGKCLEKFKESISDYWRSRWMAQHWGNVKIINPTFLYGCNTVFRKSVLLKIGLYNEGYDISYEDVELSQRLKKNEYKIIYEPNACLVHLRKDTIFSVLRTHWIWVFVSRYRTNSIIDFLHIIHEHFLRTKKLIIRDFKEKEFRLILIDIFSFFHHSLFEIKYLLYKKI